MEWLGHGKITYTHSTNPLSFKSKNGEDTDLLKVCEASTPPCRLNPLLFNGHVQTAMTILKPEGPHVYYRRKIFDAEDPEYHGTYAVDFVVDPFEEVDDSLPIRTAYYDEETFNGIASDDTKPMLVVLHGLSGGSYEIYLREVMAPMIGKGGWEACVINSRGCAKHKITSPILYNARATWDTRQTVKWLRQKFPNRPLFGIGFSLGANILTNYLGEEGENCQLKAAVVVSNPWNLEAGSLALQRTWFSREIYSKTMAGNMLRLIDLHAEQVSKNPKIDLSKLHTKKYLHEFDREIQGPSWGYPTETSYYRDASSCDSLLAVRIPLYAINASDDPIAVSEGIPFEEVKQNPYVVLCTTSLGGHLSWFEIGGGRWHSKPCAGFLNKMAFEVDLNSLSHPKVNKFAITDPTRHHFSPMRRKLSRNYQLETE